MCRDNDIASFFELAVGKVPEHSVVILLYVSFLVMFFAATREVFGNAENQSGRYKWEKSFCRGVVEQKPEESITVIT